MTSDAVIGVSETKGCGIELSPIGVYSIEPSHSVPNIISSASTMLGMNPLSTVYATKRRRRNGKRREKERID
ncbi:hypothetical protein PGB90_002680 [Kerria lacca]